MNASTYSAIRSDVLRATLYLLVLSSCQMLTAQDVSPVQSNTIAHVSQRSIYDVWFTAPKTRIDDLASSVRSTKQPMIHNPVSWVSHRTEHRTLYFQDNPLERYGKTQSPKLQPAISVFRFASDVVLAPVRNVRQKANALHFAKSPR